MWHNKPVAWHTLWCDTTNLWHDTPCYRPCDVTQQTCGMTDPVMWRNKHGAWQTLWYDATNLGHDRPCDVTQQTHGMTDPVMWHNKPGAWQTLWCDTTNPLYESPVTCDGKAHCKLTNKSNDEGNVWAKDHIAAHDSSLGCLCCSPRGRSRTPWQLCLLPPATRQRLCLLRHLLHGESRNTDT